MMPDCLRCGGEALEQLYRSSTGEEFALCPDCLTAFGEWINAGHGPGVRDDG